MSIYSDHLFTLNEISVEKFKELDNRWNQKQFRLRTLADIRRNLAADKELEIAKKHGLTDDQYFDLHHKSPLAQKIRKETNRWATAPLRGMYRIDTPGKIGKGALIRLANYMDKKGLYQNGLKKY